MLSNSVSMSNNPASQIDRSSELGDGYWRNLGVPAPARRALINAGIMNLEAYARSNLREIADLHGMGPKALKIINQALVDNKETP